MRDVAIIGAGELGGALAHVLARRDVTSQIRLIDATGQIAIGKAFDIMQASPIEQFATKVVGFTDVTRAAGVEVIVLADAAGGIEWQGEEGLRLLRQLSEIASRTVVVCAGAAQRELVDRAVRELHYPHGQIVGSAPEALAGAVRALVALETNGAAIDISLTVLGVPPAHVVVPWEDATIAGFAATRVLDEPTRRRLSARVAPLWPPGPYALATAATEAVAAVLGRSRRIISGFVAPAPMGGQRMRAAALPVRLGPGGVMKVEMPALSGYARTELDNAIIL
jgi:malate dehydrogenase